MAGLPNAGDELAIRRPVHCCCVVVRRSWRPKSGCVDASPVISGKVGVIGHRQRLHESRLGYLRGGFLCVCPLLIVEKGKGLDRIAMQ